MSDSIPFPLYVHPAPQGVETDTGQTDTGQATFNQRIQLRLDPGAGAPGRWQLRPCEPQEAAARSEAEVWTQRNTSLAIGGQLWAVRAIGGTEQGNQVMSVARLLEFQDQLWISEPYEACAPAEASLWLSPRELEVLDAQLPGPYLAYTAQRLSAEHGAAVSSSESGTAVTPSIR